MSLASHPILDREEANALEQAYFARTGESEYAVMQRAGRALAEIVQKDFLAVGSFPPAPKILVLAGKGYNAGDALLCAGALAEQYPQIEVVVWLFFPEEEMRPHAQEALRKLPGQTQVECLYAAEVDAAEKLAEAAARDGFTLCLDGIFGLNARDGLPEQVRAGLLAVNRFDAIHMRVAVDVPTGISAAGVEEDAFAADFTYATGIVKVPVTRQDAVDKVGRLRYLNLGFFDEEQSSGDFRVIYSDRDSGVGRWLPPDIHKHSRGRLLVVAGSEAMPGAALMAAGAALRAGAGLVTVAAPPVVRQVGAGHIPEAMWLALPTDEKGQIAAEAVDVIGPVLERFTGVVFGPGLGSGIGGQAVLAFLLRYFSGPMVVDADGLKGGLMGRLGQRSKAFSEVILTPHAGEFYNLGGYWADDEGVQAMRQFIRGQKVILVLKGPRSKISDGKRVWLSPAGGPVLARGGTGDMLAGMIGAAVASGGQALFEAVAGAVWEHGRMADQVARKRGELRVRTTDLYEQVFLKN